MTIRDFIKDALADVKDTFADVISDIKEAVTKTEPASPKDISHSAVVVENSSSVTLVEIDGKSYLFTPEDGSSNTPGEDTGSERVLLNGQVGILEPVPENGLGIGDPDVVNSADPLRGSFGHTGGNSFVVDGLETMGLNPDDYGAAFLDYIEGLPADQKPSFEARRAFSGYKLLESQDPAIARLRDQFLTYVNEQFARTLPEGINIPNDIATVTVFETRTFSKFYEEEFSRWHIDGVTETRDVMGVMAYTFNGEGTLVMPPDQQGRGNAGVSLFNPNLPSTTINQGSLVSQTPELNSIAVQPGAGQTAFFFSDGMEAVGGLVPAVHATPMTASTDRTILLTRYSVSEFNQQRLQLSYLSQHVPGTLSIESLNELWAIEEGDTTAVQQWASDNSSALKELYTAVSSNDNVKDRNFDLKITENFLKSNNVLYGNGGLPGGSRITTTETFHENGEVATRTSSQNGAETLHEEFDENGNQTLKRETTHQPALVDGKAVPLASSTYDFPNGTERIKSTTNFSNGVPDTKTDYTYGTEDSFGDDLKLEIGDYREETQSKLVDGQPVKTGSKLYDAEDNVLDEKVYDAEGNVTFQMQYDAEGNVESMSSAAYDAEGNVTYSSTKEKYTHGGNLWRETVFANGSETMSTYNAQSVKTASGNSLNGQWHGAVRSFDATTGDLTKVAVYTNGVEGASYNPTTNTFSGINFDGVMSTQDLTNFDSIVNSMREEGSLAFFEHPDNAKYGPLIETLDFVQAAGLPISSIENFDLTKPTEFTLDADALKTWVDQLDDVDPNARAANSDAAIRDFKKYIDMSSLRGASINGARTVGWFLTNVVAGDTGDIASLGKGLYNFAQNFSSSKLFGKTASSITPDSLGKTIAKVPTSAKAFSAAKFLGPVAAVISVGLNLYSGITGYKEAKENGASNAELAYWVFAATGGGPGGGICAAIVAKENGGSPAQVAGAFFAGLFGAYTPGQPLIGSFKADERDREARIPSRVTLETLNIPSNGSDPGFNGDTYNVFDGGALYQSRHDPAVEDAFLDYMAAYHSDSPNYVPRVPGVNGQYVTCDYFGDETYFEGEQWVWADGQMPLYGVKEGAPSPATSVDDLEIVGWTDHPTPTPELVSTPEDEEDDYDPADWGS